MKAIDGIRTRSIVPGLLFALTFCAACTGDSPVGGGHKVIPNPQSCFSYTDHLHTAGIGVTPAAAVAVAVSGELACVVLGEDGLCVVDVADPAGPYTRGSADTAGTAWDVAMSGSMAYVAYGNSGLIAVDVSAPDNPVIAGGAGTPGDARGVAVLDTIAYVADDVIGLVLFDISDPSAVSLTGVENSYGRAVGVAVSDGVAYVADELEGLRVVNVVDPHSPWLMNTVPVPENARGVALGNGIAYVATGDAGLQAVDISTTGSETVVGVFDTDGVSLGAAVARGMVFVADGHGGVGVFFANAFRKPVMVNSVCTVHALDVTVSNGFAYIAGGSGGLHVVDIAYPLPPAVVDRVEPSVVPGVTLVAAETNTVYVVDTASGLFAGRLENTTVSLTEPAGVPPEVNGIAVSGGLVYLAAGTAGIHIFDATGAGVPAFAGSVPYIGNVEDVWATGDLVYFVTGAERMGIYRPGAGDVATAQILGGITTALGVKGDYVYVATRNRMLATVNAANPDAPFVFGNSIIEGSGVEILIAGDHAYLVTSDEFGGAKNGIVVYNAQFPMFLQPVTFFPLSSRPSGAALSGSALYVALGSAGVQVIDVSDPANPSRIGQVPSDDVSGDVAAAGDFVFVADGEGGLFVLPAQECDL